LRWLSKERRAQAPDREHGAVSVLVALLMVVLLGFAALAVDVAMIYSERTQLRNGADAAAIGAAQICSVDPSGTGCAAALTSAQSLANGNALDKKSNVKEFVVDKFAREVTVTTGSLEDGQTPNRVSLIFAKALGVDSAEVTASSTAEWGGLTAGPAPFPITFSECELRDGPGWQVVEYRKSSDFTPACSGGPPGGFGSLNQVPGKCEAVVDISLSAAGNNTGNNGAPLYCESLLNKWRAAIQAGKPPTGLFPIYTAVTDSGSNAVYNLSGFAAFEVHGWKFKQTGNPGFPDAFRDDYYPGYRCKDTHCIGIIGKFVKMVSIDNAYTLGPYDPTMGTAIVRLTPKESES
jgi:Flp pilus assembly protein TadG